MINHMKKNTPLLLLLWAILFVACNSKPSPPPITNEEYYFEQDDVYSEAITDNTISKDSASQHENIPQQVYDIWSYTPQNVDLPAQITMESIVSDQFSKMKQCYDYNYIGGPKLIGEMSADKAGYNYSYYAYPITLDILSLSQLHLKFISSSNNIICQILDGKIEIKSSKIVSSNTGMSIEIEVTNLSATYQEVAFEQGQMVETIENHAQNAVITSNATAQIAPNKDWHFRLPIFCAAHHRISPSGHPARLTPYVMNAPTTTFQSQQTVWKLLESDDDPNSYVTFYVWGKGAITSSGRASVTGHAFVRIPEAGVFGFSSAHGGLLDDDGNIYDHTSDIRYATDSCRIKVSDVSKKAIIKKLKQLQANVPKYRIGHYDCTSFVMDIADAGGIHYGNRATIQTPVGFMQELKKHNYSN